MPILTSFNGVVTDQMPILDRGFLYGDSVYEVCPGYGEKMFLFEEHLERMIRNAKALKILPPNGDWKSIKPLIQNLRSQHPKPDHYVRWILSRGVSPIHLKIFENTPSNLTIIINDLNEYPKEIYETGIKLYIASIERTSKKALDPRIKSGNYLNNILALDEALNLGFDDTLMLNPQGEVSEAAMSNVFFIDTHGKAHTPKIESGLLDGITRSFIIRNIFPKINLEVQERSIHPSEIVNFKECFLSASIKGITPVYQIGSHHFLSAAPDSITKKIMNLYNSLKRF